MPPQPPTDDVGIPDDAELWRRIGPKWWIFDENSGLWRPSSAAFQNMTDTEAVSMTLASEVNDPSTFLAGHEGYGLVSLTAGAVRECHQIIVRAPENGTPGHVHVIGKKNKAIQRRLAAQARIVVHRISPAAGPGSQSAS